MKRARDVALGTVAGVVATLVAEYLAVIVVIRRRIL